MTALHLQHVLRMERVIACLRLVAVLVAGVELLRAPSWFGPLVLEAIWGAALLYAVGTLAVEPYRKIPTVTWNVVSGLIDWGFITLGIVFTGTERSSLHLLYFLSVLSTAMRFGLREVLVAGVGTAVGYLCIVMAFSPDWATSLPLAGTSMGYLILFAAGSGVLARELTLQFKAHIAEEAQRLAVQEMTTTVSHDLKNPLAAVSGLVDLLLDSAADNFTFDQRALLHRIDANTRQMANLVANLLDAELIESGQQAFRLSPVDLNATVRRVVEAQAHQAEAKHIGLVLDLDPHLSAAVVDEHMIERLVLNLLSNAVKFTPESGAIRVSTRVRPSALAIEVWDSGPDVPSALKSILFEKFVRQQDSPGIGLGLYICKSIVDAHRGTISLQRPTGGGVTFVVELPQTSAAAMEATVRESRTVRRPAGKHAWQPARRAGALVKG